MAVMERSPFTGDGDALAEASRVLQTAANREGVLQTIVDVCVDALAGCAYAGISTDQNGRPNSPVVSDPAVLRIDAGQYSLGAGPCLLAMRGPDEFVESADLEHDERFGLFGNQAAADNCRSVLAHRLYVDSRTLGSLNLYATEVDAFDHEDRRRSFVLAGLASLALAVAELEFDAEGLRQAIESRDVIGQAKGVLMERHGMTADEAFQHLRAESQRRNLRLRVLAEQLTQQEQRDV